MGGHQRSATRTGPASAGAAAATTRPHEPRPTRGNAHNQEILERLNRVREHRERVADHHADPSTPTPTFEPSPPRHAAPPYEPPAETPTQPITGLPIGHHPMGRNGEDLQSFDIREDGIDFNVIHMGTGAANEENEVQGPHVRASVGNVAREGEPARWGIRGEASTAEVHLGDDDLGVDLTTPRAEAEASIGEEGFVLQTEGSILEADGHARAESLGDSRAEYGLSAGSGFGFRGHWRDTDDDDNTEIGFGLTAGIGHFDVTTELFSQAWNALTGGGEDD